MNSTPRVSIGLPVYNGELYLRSAIESILAQSLGDFELLIADNASTDGSLDISNEFANIDRRITVYQSETNLGAPVNFNRTFEHARCEYFKWAAHDDLLEPRYLEMCVQVLDAEPDYVFCHSRVRVIDANGDPVRDYSVEMPELESEVTAARFAEMALTRHACYDAFAVIRTRILHETPLIGGYLSSDRCLLAELALHGKIKILSDVLYLNREHGDRSVRIPNHERARKWFHQGGDSTFIFPAWRLPLSANVSETVIPFGITVGR